MTQSTKNTIADSRIIGTFIKQAGDDAISIGEESFDATDAILLMPYSDVVAIKDYDDSSDKLGREHVQWNGPYAVRIVGSILEYFGVTSLDDVTPESLESAKQLVNPQPAQECTLTLTIKVNVRIANGVGLNDFIENLDYSIVSNTAGAVVTGTEIIDSEDLPGSN